MLCLFFCLFSLLQSNQSVTTMSLRSAVTDIAKSVDLTVPPPLKALPNNSSSIYDESVCKKTVEVYRSLIAEIDRLLLYEASIELESEGTTINKEVDAAELSAQKDITEFRRLVIEQTMIVLPLLRGLHEVEGIPDAELILGEKMKKRDQLSLQIMDLQQQVDEQQQSLIKLKAENRDLRSEIHFTRDHTDQPPQISIDDQRELDAAKKMVNQMRQEIYGLLITHGESWADGELKDLMLEVCAD